MADDKTIKLAIELMLCNMMNVRVQSVIEGSTTNREFIVRVEFGIGFSEGVGETCDRIISLCEKMGVLAKVYYFTEHSYIPSEG